MEKYSRLSKITTDFLNGKLAKLQVNYEDDNSMQLHFLYEDDNHYWFDYDILISIDGKIVEHASHHSEGYLNKVELNRDSAFEKAVFKELFSSLQIA
ncbi:hypothetical protein [Candidatus Xianfuyuplasma coldseepsis]|uniref:Uncharacterized protein n=1 Tax=Candidatus Xianfuyuplasma coldseepsis TaxID=2782163 RepID=A0A7L7KS82_9MOLU|nr:hypothetical protein [Xianfuyuplasma coldseepsis]QMS85577.1 hypothetical protein G4Z02_07425 [Xianfuyuplasma coldseepsis]